MRFAMWSPRSPPRTLHGEGSEHACSVLGWANKCGHHGFDKNPDEATNYGTRQCKSARAATRWTSTASARPTGCATTRRGVHGKDVGNCCSLRVGV